MKDQRTSVLSRYSYALLSKIYWLQGPKFIRNKKGKYELKGTVDPLFHRLSMNGIKIVQKLQIHTALQWLPQSNIA